MDGTQEVFRGFRYLVRCRKGDATTVSYMHGDQPLLRCCRLMVDSDIMKTRHVEDDRSKQFMFYSSFF